MKKRTTKKVRNKRRFKEKTNERDKMTSIREELLEKLAFSDLHKCELAWGMKRWWGRTFFIFL